MTDQVICYGTAWVPPVHDAKMPAREAHLPHRTPHLTSPGLDCSFLTDLFIHTTGQTWKEFYTAERDQPIDKSLIYRVGGAPFTSPRTYHLYDCSDRFCQGVSTLTQQRIREIAANWRTIYGTATPQATNEPSPQRLSVLTRLVELARDAAAIGAPLRLRVDYRGTAQKP